MKTPSKKPSNTDILAHLRSQLRSFENGQKTIDRNADRISSGCDALDQMLPTDGFLPGQLVEWLVEGAGHGGSTLALTLARTAIQSNNKALVIIDRQPTNKQWAGDHLLADGSAMFYPPAAAELGIGLHQLIILRPNNAADEIWAIDQSLRCPCVGAVWAWIPKLNDRDFRRFQLAAEEGSTLGLFVRPASTRGEPTWADVQILVEPRPSVAWNSTKSMSDGASATAVSCARRPFAQATHPSATQNTRTHTAFPLRRRWQITLLRCRGGTAGKQLLLELDEISSTLSGIDTIAKPTTTTGASKHEKNPLPLAAELAHPTPRLVLPKPTSTQSIRNRNSA